MISDLDLVKNKITYLSDKSFIGNVRDIRIDKYTRNKKFKIYNIYDERNYKDNCKCTICTLKLCKSDEAITTKCNHTFHKKCIFSWIQSDAKNKNLCPNCREDMLLKCVLTKK